MNVFNLNIPSEIRYDFTDTEGITHKFRINKIDYRKTNVIIGVKPKKYICIKYSIYYKKMQGDKEIRKYKCQIPYYLSDGQTNHFRLNLLFPYMCIVNNTRTCPLLLDTNKYNPGLLLKYGDVCNFKIRDFHNDISTQVFSNTDTICDTTYKENCAKKNDDLCDNVYKCEKYGVNSVLARMCNILDFILAISSYYIPANYDEKDVVKTYPNYDDTFDKFDIQNDNYDINEETFYNKNKNLGVVYLYDQAYRKFLMEFLIKSKNILINNNNNPIQVKYETIIIDNTTNTIDPIQTINNFINKICDNDLVSRDANVNHSTYKFISYHMAEMLQQDVRLDKFYKDKIELKPIEKPTLGDLVTGWNTTCDYTNPHVKTFNI